MRNAVASLQDRLRELVVVHWASPLTEQSDDKGVGLQNRFPGRVYEPRGDPVPGIDELVAHLRREWRESRHPGLPGPHYRHDHCQEPEDDQEIDEQGEYIHGAPPES